MHLTQLRYYVVICQEKSITRAAERLFISKQALSNILKKMETVLGVTLFVRVSSGLTPTEEGQRFFKHAKKILEYWDDSVEDVLSARAAQCRQMRVGFAYMCINLWHEEMSAAFARANADIDLLISSKTSQYLLEDLDQKALDVVVSCMQTDKLYKYNKLLIRDMPLHITVCVEDPLAKKATITPFDLAGRTVIYPESGMGFMNTFSNFMAEIGVLYEVHLIPAGNFLAAMKITRENQFLYLSSNIFSEVLPNVDGFVTKPLTYHGKAAMPTCKIHAIYHKDADCVAAIERFADFFANAIKAH